MFGTQNQSQTLDDLNLAMPRVKGFSKPMNSKLVNKPKGNRVQFDENQGKTDKSYHIANHHNVERDGTSKSEMKNNDQKQSLSRSNNNSTKNTDTTTNTETCQVPYWQPLSRSRTAPDLNSSNGNITFLANKDANSDISCVQTTSKVSVADDRNVVNATGDDCKENLGLPKAPARKLSSHKSVVQYKKSKFEADDRNNINMAKPQQYGLPLHKVKAEDDDENNSVNWRPLRDFF